MLKEIKSVLFVPFDYLKSGTIIGSIFLHLYMIIFIVLSAALIRNIFDNNNQHRNTLIFGKIIILILLSIIYWAMKYVLDIF